MSSFSAFLALTTARDKLHTVPGDDLEEFADVLALLNDAIPASKDPECAQSALDLCKRAFARFNEVVAERYSASDKQLSPRAGEAAQVVRGALYHAAVELRSALREQPEPVAWMARSRIVRGDRPIAWPVEARKA